MSTSPLLLVRVGYRLRPALTDSLQGVAKEVYHYHVKNLAPLGYKMRVEVLNYPGGVPGDIGIFFRW